MNPSDPAEEVAQRLWRWPRAPLRSYLVAVTLLATVPLAVLLSYQILGGVRAQQLRLDQELVRGATALAQGIDRELSATAEALYILSGNEALLTGDTAAFQASLTHPRPLRSVWASVFLMAPDGALVFDTAADAGATEGRVLADLAKTAQAGPAVSDLVAIDGRAGRATAVAVPVMQDGRVTYLLGAWIDADQWQAMLDAAATPTDGFLSLHDSQGRLIAHSLPAERSMVRPVSANSAQAAAQAMSGSMRGMQRTALQDGSNALSAWQSLGFGPWRASVGVRGEALGRAQDREVGRALAVVAACLLLGVWLASLLARRLVEPLARLAHDDAQTTPTTSPVLEIDLLRDRLLRSRTEEAAARLRVETKAAEFEALFDGSPIALAFAQDKQCRVVVHNAAMDALFGQPGEGESTLLMVLHDGRPLPREQQPLQRAARSGEPVPAMELEVTAPGLPGKVMLAQAVPLFDLQGRPRGAIGAAVDITLRKEAEARLMEAHRERASLMEREQAARIEAERANQAKDEFLAMLGHELRNPLGAIASAMEVLGHPGAGAAQVANAREIAARQTRNLARMLDDVLDVARVVSGKVLLTRQPLDLAALVQRVVATLQIGSHADEHPVKLALESAWVDADPTRVEQVVTNLFTNAVKYTPTGSRIELGVCQADGWAVLQVRDHGPGIAPGLLPHVFDMFVQGERGLDRRAGGLGVGLTLVRRLVELHGGTVQATSSGQGSVFEVRLPAVPALPAPAADPLRNDVRRARPCRVVLIEDNPDAAQALRSILELDGHQVFAAEDGLAGLELLLAQWPDAAIVDLGLPGLTGFEVALRSRAAGFPGVMLAVSGYGQQGDAQRALQNGFDALLVKPVDPAALRRWLAEAG